MYAPCWSVLLIFTALLRGTPAPAQAPAAGPPGVKGPAAEYLQALLRFEPWAESVWKDYPAVTGAGYFGDGASGGNGGIRGSCGIALSYAVLIRALPQDPRRGHRLARVAAALRYATATHRSAEDSVPAVDGHRWGVTPAMSSGDPRGWQSSLWASSLGFAAAMLDKELDPALLQACRRVVAAEADWLSRKPPPSGYRFDSKAEENAWQSNIAALAASWMPDDPRAARWLETAKRYLANTYTVPADSSGELSAWITTQTLYPSYALENHGFYHPTYQMVAGMSMGDAYLMARLINPSLAAELRPFAEHNVRKVWGFLQGIVLDSGDLAFPSGLDWSLHSFEHVSYLAWMAAHFREPQAQWAEPRLALQILERQAVNGDGRFVGESCPDGFYREAVEARRIAIAYLQDAAEGFPLAPGKAPAPFIAHYPDAGLIVQRSARALVTVSYGPKTMALVIPLGGRSAAQRFAISPNTGSLIGDGGQTRLLSFKKQKGGFRAELQLDSRQGRRSRMIIASYPQGVVFLELPGDSCRLPGGRWLVAALENDPLTGGQRTLYGEGDSVVFPERSGQQGPAMTKGWVNVDQWLGVAAAGPGSFRYQAAGGYNRNGAAEDFLSFRPADSTAPRALLLLPGVPAAATRQAREHLHWKPHHQRLRLRGVLPGGHRFRIRADLEKIG